jgi:hypothetical protein
VNRRMGLTLQLSNQVDRADEVLEGRKKNNRAGLGIPLQRRKSAEENEHTQSMNNQQLYDDHKQRLAGEFDVFGDFVLMIGVKRMIKLWIKFMMVLCGLSILLLR